MSEERYKIEGKIGRGGIGAVYRAFDHQLGRPVALKRMLPPEESDSLNPEDASENLLKEAKVLSTLNHPNIVTVFDVGADTKGVFVVMELLDGETLDETIARGVLTSEDFKEVVTQTLEALIAAQDVDLVHRDLKPSNIMVVWLPSGKFQLKVLDFGLAKFSEQPSVQTSDQGDAIMGSIFFMAPEQFERGQLDARTDMYSLGCIFYHCLTGKYPFQGETAAQVMASHLQNKMVPLEKYRPDLPLHLCLWVKWLLQREMGDRPPDAKTALEHFMNETVGLASLEEELEAPTTGVSLVTPEEETGSAPVLVTAARPAVPPVGVSVPPAGVALPASGSTGGVTTVLKSSQKSSKGKWIATGISAGLILAIGTYILINRMITTKEENWFGDIIAEEVPYGDPPTVKRLLKYLDSKYDNNRRNAAVAALSRMEGDGIDEEIMEQLKDFRGPELKALVTCLTVRGYEPAMPEFLRLAASSPSAEVRTAALNGISILGKQSHLGELLDILQKIDKNTDKNVKEWLERAILTISRKVEDESARTFAMLKTLDSAKEGAYRKSLLSILGSLGGEKVLRRFEQVLKKGDQEYQYDVLAALMHWPDASASKLLQKIAEETQDDAVRLAAARAYIRMIGVPAVRSPEETQKMLDIAWTLADERKEKARIFPILANIPQDWASDYAGKYLEDPIFKSIASRTQDNIRELVGRVVPLQSGKPLRAAKASLGGNYQAIYEDKSSHKCITNWSDPGTWVSWSFIVEEPGTYKVEVSQANDGAAGSEYAVIVGENILEGKVKDTREWTRFIDDELGQVTFAEPGIYTLTVAPRGTAKKFIMNLREVTLTRAG